MKIVDIKVHRLIGGAVEHAISGIELDSDALLRFASGGRPVAMPVGGHR